MPDDPTDSGERRRFDDVASLFGPIVPPAGTPVRPPGAAPRSLPGGPAAAIDPDDELPAEAFAGPIPSPPAQPQAVGRSKLPPPAVLRLDGGPPVRAPAPAEAPPSALTPEPKLPPGRPADTKTRRSEVPWPDAFEPRPNYQRLSAGRIWTMIVLVPLALVIAASIFLIDPRTIRQFVDRTFGHGLPQWTEGFTNLLPEGWRPARQDAPPVSPDAAPTDAAPAAPPAAPVAPAPPPPAPAPVSQGPDAAPNPAASAPAVPAAAPTSTVTPTPAVSDAGQTPAAPPVSEPAPAAPHEPQAASAPAAPAPTPTPAPAAAPPEPVPPPVAAPQPAPAEQFAAPATPSSEPSSAPAAPPAAAPPAAAPEPAPAAPVSPPAPAIPHIGRAAIFYRRGQPAAEAEAKRIAALLQSAGAAVEIRAAGSTSRSPTITYPRFAERKVASELARALASNGTGWILRQGNIGRSGGIEIWLP